MVNVSSETPTKSSYEVSLNGTGTGKVSFFDYALDRVFFVDNTQSPIELYSQNLNHSNKSLKTFAFNANEIEKCHGMRVTNSGLVYGLFEKSTDHSFYF